MTNLVQKLANGARLLELPATEIERLRDISEKVGMERLHILFNVVSKGYEDISRSVTPRFTLEMMLLRASKRVKGCGRAPVIRSI